MSSCAGVKKMIDNTVISPPPTTTRTTTSSPITSRFGCTSQVAALFDDFMQFGSVGLHIVDSNGTILWANAAELELLGYTEEEYIGQPIQKFHIDPLKFEYVITTLLSGNKVVNCVAPIKCKDGHVEYVEINSSVRTVNGKVSTTRCFSTCVTDRVLREKAQQDAIRMQSEKEAAENLLYNMLPKEIAARLKTDPSHIADHHECATVLFADIVGFTEMSSIMSATAVVGLLNDLFSRFDHLVDQYKLNKVKTVSADEFGCPTPSPAIFSYLQH